MDTAAANGQTTTDTTELGILARYLRLRCLAASDEPGGQWEMRLALVDQGLRPEGLDD